MQGSGSALLLLRSSPKCISLNYTKFTKAGGLIQSFTFKSSWFMMLRWQERKEVMKSRIYPRGLISGEREISINANIFKQKVSPKFQFKDNFLEPSFGDISNRLISKGRADPVINTSILVYKPLSLLMEVKLLGKITLKHFGSTKKDWTNWSILLVGNTFEIFGISLNRLIR